MRKFSRDTMLIGIDPAYKDSYSLFRVKRVTLVWDEKLGNFRESTKLEDVVRFIRHAFGRATRVFRTRHVVYHLDCADGIMSVRSERWSWRRWRWEVV